MTDLSTPPPATQHIPCLDHGYVKFIEHWGSDARIVETARTSTDKGFLGWGPQQCSCVRESLADGMIVDRADPDCPKCKGSGTVPGDEKLLKYLYEHKHSTPFEFAGLTIEVQAPLFIFRQWHRHRTQSYNEMSARYVPLPNVNYMPEVDRCIVVKGTGNKQAGKVADRVPTHAEVLDWLENYLQPAYDAAQRSYDRGNEIGIPKELSRLSVNVARYTRMRATANLRNWLAFLTLRRDSHAQHEVQVYANAVGDFISNCYPKTWDLFVVGRQRDDWMMANKGRIDRLVGENR